MDPFTEKEIVDLLKAISESLKGVRGSLLSIDAKLGQLEKLENLEKLEKPK